MANQALPPESVPDDNAMARAEAKPPLYRLFRGAMYAIYMAIVVWFCMSLIVAAWSSVWGPSGQALRQSEAHLHH